MDLAEYITRFCHDHKITKDKLAKSADMSRSTLYRMLEEDATPTLINLTKLAVAMQVHPQYLVKLEWDKYALKDCYAKPINPLEEPKRWFHKQQDSSHFIGETVADGSLICTSERFTKTWRLQNTGEVIWKNRRLQCQDNNKPLQQQPELQPFTKSRCFSLIPTVTSIDIPTTKPGDIVDLTVEFIAPDIPASVFSYWKMVDKNGAFCFLDSIGVYIAVQVISGGAACSIID